MNDPQPAQQFDHSSDPRFFADYVEKSATTSTRQHFIRVRDKVLSLLAQQHPGQKKFRVLDIGCGAGTQARVWAECGHEAFGLDVNAPLLEAARDQAEREGLYIRFDLGSATRLPHADGSLDACLMLELIEHVADWQTCVSEAVRVLKPGGLLYLSTTNRLCPLQNEFNLPLYSWYPARLKRHFERLATTSRPEIANYARYPAVNWFTFYTLRRFLAGAGLESFDRFDLVDSTRAGRIGQGILWLVKGIPLVRLLGHAMTPGTIVVGIRRGS